MNPVLLSNKLICASSEGKNRNNCAATTIIRHTESLSVVVSGNHYAFHWLSHRFTCMISSLRTLTLIEDSVSHYRIGFLDNTSSGDSVCCTFQTDFDNGVVLATIDPIGEPMGSSGIACQHR